MIATLIFLAVVIIAAAIICWAIGKLAGAFAPSEPKNAKLWGQIVVVLQVLVVLIALAYVLQHFGIG